MFLSAEKIANTSQKFIILDFDIKGTNGAVKGDFMNSKSHYIKF